jgi:hypothetical protein
VYESVRMMEVKAMPLRIKNPKDFWTGTLYLTFGAVVLWIARDYPIGSTGRMGPGYFPTVLAVLLMGIGAYIVIRGFARAGEPLGQFAWRGTLCVIAATAAFGYLLERAGMIIALLVLIFGSAAASAQFRLEWRAGLLALGLVVFCVLVFVRGLGVSMPLLGSWIGG